MSPDEISPANDLRRRLKVFGPQWMIIGQKYYLCYGEVLDERGWYIATTPNDPHLWRINPERQECAWVVTGDRMPRCIPPHHFDPRGLIKIAAEGVVTRRAKPLKLARQIIAAYVATGLVDPNELTEVLLEVSASRTPSTKIEEYRHDSPGSSRLQLAWAEALAEAVTELVRRYHGLPRTS